MSKKKASKKKRPASAARRKATKSRSSRGRRPSAASTRPGPVRLKPVLVLIERTIADLRRLPPAESTEVAIKQLELAKMAVGDVCDPNTPGGCGPTMEFPPPTP